MKPATLVTAFFAAAAVGIVGYMGSRVYQSHEQLLVMQRIEATRQAAAERSAKLNERFKQIDMNRFMRDPVLITPEGVAAGRAELAKYRALLAERDVLAERELSEYRGTFAALPPGTVRDQMIAGEQATEPRTRELYQQLARAQADNADAVAALFDWVDANRPLLKLRDGRLVTATPQQESELQTLSRRIAATSEAADKVFALTQQVSQEIARRQDLLRRQLGY